MKALLHLLLLAGILVGVATQGAALAAEPCPMDVHSSAMAGMEDCCPEGDCTSEDGVLWDDMAFHCLAMAGCATLAALESTASIGVTDQNPGTHRFWPMATTLDGWSVPPDTHPPALLG